MESPSFVTLFVISLHRLFRFLFRRRLTILAYHGVAPGMFFGEYHHGKKFIDPLMFAKQMEYLRRKYTILPLDEALLREQEGTLPAYPLSVIFLGGYKNIYTYAFPVLRAHTIPSSVFVDIDFIHRHKLPWEDRLEYLIRKSPHGENTSEEEKKFAYRALIQKLVSIKETVKETRIHELEERAGISLKHEKGANPAISPLSWEECRLMRPWRITFGICSPGLNFSRLPSIQKEEKKHLYQDDVQKLILETGKSLAAIVFTRASSPSSQEEVDFLSGKGIRNILYHSLSPVKDSSIQQVKLLRYIPMDGTDDWKTFLLSLSRLRRPLS